MRRWHGRRQRGARAGARRGAIILAVAVVGALLGTPIASVVPGIASTGATGGLERIGVAPRMPAGARPLAGIAATTRMHVTVALAPRDPAALAAYARAVADPASADFRRYLTVAAFARRFAPAPDVAGAVAASLRAHGLQLGRVSANGLSIGVETTAGAVEHAFSLSLARVALAHGGDAILNTAAPALDAQVAGDVQAVIGLTTLDHPRPLLVRAAAGGRRADLRSLTAPRVATGGPQPCGAAVASAPGQDAYTTDQIASAYGFAPLYRAGDEGAGVTVALYELEPDAASDIAAYQACYGTHVAISYVTVDGGAGSGAGSGEAALDIEQIIGLAPKVNLIVYQGPNSNLDNPGSGPYDVDSEIVSQDAASVVSTSWGQCEPVEGRSDATAEDVLFEEAAVQGQTMISAAGDDGAEDCDTPGSLPNIAVAADDPASQPFVTGVGGTSLKSLGPPPSETVWNNGGNLTGLLGVEPGAGGGGISAFWPMPAYQSSAPAGLNVIQSDSSATPCAASSGDCREVPDVSADADPLTGYLIYYNGSGSVRGSPSGWQGTGGTSGAAPLWAAVFALADAEKACQGVPIGFANPVLYRLAGAGEDTYFNDVTSGNNDFTGTSGGRYPAGPGYDMATGLGTPRTAALAPALCAQTLRLATPGPLESFRRTAVRFQLPGADAADAGLRFAATGLPPGLSLGVVSGRISGLPRAFGTFHVVVTAADATLGVRTVRFPWTIAGRPAVSRVRLGGVGSGAPALSLRVAAGRDEAPIVALRLGLPAGVGLARFRRDLVVTGPGGRRLKASLATGRGGRGPLLIRLRTPARTVTLSLAPGALAADGALAAAVRDRRAGGLHAQLTVTDELGSIAPLKLTLRPRS